MVIIEKKIKLHLKHQFCLVKNRKTEFIYKGEKHSTSKGSFRYIGWTLLGKGNLRFCFCALKKEETNNSKG